MNKRIFLSPPHMEGGELDYIKKAFNSNYIAPLGPQVDAFEKEFAKKNGVSHALAVSSGTAALHLALKIIGVDYGSEVFASTLTFIGSVSPITFLGGAPVFIDSEKATWNLDPELLANELKNCKRLPKAIVPTELYGQCIDMDAIVEICAPPGVPVIVDAAEALGATYKRKSNRKGAKASIFSFNGNKIITTSGGGMLVSDDGDFIERARFLSQQARDDYPHYQHSEIGYNYRMSNILAAIGLGQLEVLDRRVEQKRNIFNYYKKALENIPGIDFMPEAEYGKSNRWLTVILITKEEFGLDREAVRLALEKKNIESRPVWKPMHLQPVFINNSNARFVAGETALDLFNRGLCLPSGTALTKKDLDRIINIIMESGN